MNAEFSVQTKQRILIIDDNSEIHQDFRKILGVQHVAQNRPSDAETALFGTQSGTLTERSECGIIQVIEGVKHVSRRRSDKPDFHGS